MMSSWLVTEKRSWPEWLALQVLKVGPIPKHLALIMDGNRRYAKLHEQETFHGHIAGFKTLTYVLAWCRDLGITEVTSYALSIENFKRSKEEVEGLLSLASNKFEEVLNEGENLAKHGVCIRIIGNLDLLPTYLRAQTAEVVLMTRNNTKCFLNLALAYTSRDEITAAVRECAIAISEGRLQETDITPRLLEQCLYTAQSCHPDLVIRTSGETRLSDFLLWQSQFSCLFFTKVLWPELSIWHVLGAVFHYQRHHHTVVAARKQAKLLYDRYELEADQACSPDDPECGCDGTKARKIRVERFIADLVERREKTYHALSTQLKEIKKQQQESCEQEQKSEASGRVRVIGECGERVVSVSVADPSLLKRVQQRMLLEAN
ncbi:dehydrodolichyl diphosphate synthase complex subunit DHDDS-like isoform X1 [Hyalella azteca]|uniref:Alkyl transferase n=2 Tax=Hyalella azteca TaxID=294128 RepID=A0A979FTX0_HYAAZ|nr:dehydrodolichyl diphosphate synthase complex subunit DHDDS-like isoform X1 [Hyalella azteca]